MLVCERQDTVSLIEAICELGKSCCRKLGSKVLLGNQNQVVPKVGFAADRELVVFPNQP